MDMFTVLIVLISQMYTYVQMYQIVCFRCVQFIVCQLYLSKAVFKITYKKKIQLLYFKKSRLLELRKFLAIFRFKKRNTVLREMQLGKKNGKREV